MLNALKQLIGLAPRDNTEIWQDVPVIIVDQEGQEIFAGACDVEYLPSPESYEHGSAKIYDRVTGSEVMTFTVFHLEKSVGSTPVAYWARYDATGVTMDAQDSTGRLVTILVRRPAETYMLETEELLPMPPIGPEVVLEPGEVIVDEAIDDAPLDDDLL